MKLIGHIFDTTANSPADHASVTVHCGKILTVKPINRKSRRPVKMCDRCRQRSEQFMASHSNIFVHTIFILEEEEVVKGKGKK